MSSWELGIDFGTSYTVAAIAQEGNVTVIDVESSGQSRIPSSVFLNQDGRILVGTAAQHQAAFTPERYEPTPKRSFGEGELFLGDRLVPVTELAAAVIRRVYTEASLQQGETAPSAVRITHPANWSEARLGVLREAVEKAGLSTYELLAEPVAAAARIGLLSTEPGDVVAVYDFGGGTFDAAVLRRSDDGFEVAGPPTGRDPLGGEDIDQRIIEHLSSVLADGYKEEWAALLKPTDTGWRRKATGLHAEVQRAKETLSEASVCQLWIPGLERDAQLTRAELEQLIAADISATVDTLEQALAAAQVSADDLAGIYMVGGSSRIPLVADTLWRRLKVRPEVQENPKSIVAMGAAGWDLLTQAAQRRQSQSTTAGDTTSVLTAQPTDLGPTAVVPRLPMPEPGTAEGTFRSQLIMAVDLDSWPEGCTCMATIEVDRPGKPPTTLRARDEPAGGTTTAQRADQIGAFRAQRTPGYLDHGVWPFPVLGQDGMERRFAMATGRKTLEMFEQYLISEDRVVVLACPMAARDLADSLTYERRSLAPGEWFEARFALPLPVGWTAAESVTLRRNGSNHIVVARRATLPPQLPASFWRLQQIDELLAGRAQARIVSDVAGPVLNHFSGEIVTARWLDKNGVTMLTKRGLVVFEGMGFTMTITLPITEQSLFSALARQARLHPDQAPAL